MSKVIDIVIPTFGRAGKLDDVAANIMATTPADSFEIVFVVDISDEDSVLIASSVHAPSRSVIISERGYPVASNRGYENSTADLVAIVNDDCLFHDNWFDALMEKIDPAYGVYGTNDLSPLSVTRNNTTQPVVAHWYIDQFGGAWDEPGKLYHERYWHNFCETELWYLACQRERAIFVDNCVIEHIHPDWGKAELDETYRKHAKQNWNYDEELFRQRKALWESR